LPGIFAGHVCKQGKERMKLAFHNVVISDAGRRSVAFVVMLFGFAVFCLGCVTASAGRIAPINDPEADKYNKAILAHNTGVDALAKGEYADAVKHFQSALKIHPGLLESLLDLGIIHELFLNKPEDAKKVYEKLRKLYPDDFRLKRLLEEKKAGPKKTAGPPAERVEPTTEKEELAGKPAAKPKKAEPKNPALVRARTAMGKAEYRVALREFLDARGEELTTEEEEEVLLSIGVCYAAMEKDAPARENFSIALKKNPRQTLPAEKYPDRVYKVFGEMQLKYPAPRELKIKEKNLLVFQEPIIFEYAVTAPCKFTILIQPLGERDVLLKRTIQVDAKSLSGTIAWKAGESHGFELRPRTYRIEITTEGPEKWIWKRIYEMPLNGNFDARVVREVAWKEDRIRSLSGQLHVTHIPGKKRWELVEKPTKVSFGGYFTYPYYCTVGALRDGFDFPIKFLYSMPGLGHALTIAHPVTAYTMVKGSYGVDKDDYYDPFWGFDDTAYNKDKSRVRVTAIGVALSTFLVLPAVAAVVSWAGTDDGLAEGFLSYYRSNAFSEGYKDEYFFPNWRSMNFNIVRVDSVREKALLKQAAKKNEALNRQIGKRNETINKFNMESFSRFKSGLYSVERKNLENILMVDVKLEKGRDVK